MSQTIDVKRYEELARQKQGEHRKFLAQLKKKAPKNLDKIVQEVHNEMRMVIRSSSLCLVHFWDLIISVISMTSAPRLVQLFLTRIVRKSIRLII